MISKTVTAIAIGLLGVMLVITAWGWIQIPAGKLIPIHWGISGEANGYAPKEIGLLIAPVIAAALTLLLAVVPHFEPRYTNLRRSSGAYGTVVIGFLAFFTGIHALAVAAALGASFDMGRLVCIGVGILFAVIGNTFGKVRSNFFFGIRTPWTLTSERSWNRTHRVGGWAFVAVGVATALAGFFAPGLVAFIVLMGGLLVAVVGLFVYSYIVWRDDPDRVPRS